MKSSIRICSTQNLMILGRFLGMVVIMDTVYGNNLANVPLQ